MTPAALAAALAARKSAPLRLLIQSDVRAASGAPLEGGANGDALAKVWTTGGTRGTPGAGAGLGVGKRSWVVGTNTHYMYIYM